MARVVTFTAILIGMLALINIAGIPTASQQFLTAVGFFSQSNVVTSLMYLAVAGIFALTGAGIIIGTFSRQSGESFIVAGFSASLLLWGVADFASLANYMNSICPVGSSCVWAAYVIDIIMFILIGGYMVSLVQWWRGNDI